MSLKNQVFGLNRFLTMIYGRDTRLSLLLANLGFDLEQIEFLRSQYLEPVATDFLTVIKERIESFRDGERLYTILMRRVGLDGNPPDTLQCLGEEFGISRERIRQLEKKILRRCKHKAHVRFWEERLREIAQHRLRRFRTENQFSQFDSISD